MKKRIAMLIAVGLLAVSSFALSGVSAAATHSPGLGGETCCGYCSVAK